MRKVLPTVALLAVLLFSIWAYYGLYVREAERNASRRFGDRIISARTKSSYSCWMVEQRLIFVDHKPVVDSQKMIMVICPEMLSTSSRPPLNLNQKWHDLNKLFPLDAQ